MQREKCIRKKRCFMKNFRLKIDIFLDSYFTPKIVHMALYTGIYIYKIFEKNVHVRKYMSKN